MSLKTKKLIIYAPGQSKTEIDVEKHDF